MKLINYKNVLSIFTSVILSANILSLPLSVFSSEIKSNTQPQSSEIADSESFSVPTFGKIMGVPSIEPTYDENLQTYSLKNKSASYPADFDLRNSGVVTSVKNQGKYGTCWAHACASCAETNLIKYDPSINISEWHTAYYCYSGGDQMEFKNGSGSDDLTALFNKGGTCFYVTNLWAQWIGPVYENKLPYLSDFTSDSTLVEKLKNSSDYHLEDASLFDYKSDGSDRDTVNLKIKEYLSRGQSIDASFYSDNSYINNTNHCCMTDKTHDDANHSITITGWNDNYPAENFNETCRPKNNGAWLVKNSWGDNWQDNGYFWLSYEDSSLCEFSTFEFAPSDNFDTNYQYDSFMPARYMSASDETDSPSYIANVFTASDEQMIDAVSTYFVAPQTTYEVTIYTDLKDKSNPSSGKASSVTKGTSDMTGYFTIHLDKGVKVKKNSDFSAVVKLYCAKEKYIIPVETNLSFIDRNNGSTYEAFSAATYQQIQKYTAKNQSFFSEDGKSWSDTCDTSFTYSDDEKNTTISNIEAAYGSKVAEKYKKYAETCDLTVTIGNISLKAFGNNVNKVDFSHSLPDIPLDESVALSSESGSAIKYSLNDGDFTDYSSPIKITSDTKITATCDDKTFYTKSFEPAAAEFGSLSCKTDEGLKDAQRINAHSYKITVPETTSSIQFFPISQAKVAFNDSVLDCYKLSEPVSVANGLNTFKFKLTQDNRNDNTVTLTVIRGAVQSLGDVDGNSIINAIDASIILTAYSKISIGNGSELTSQQLSSYDIDSNSTVNAVDASLVLSYYAYVSNGGTSDFEGYINGKSES